MRAAEGRERRWVDSWSRLQESNGVNLTVRHDGDKMQLHSDDNNIYSLPR